MVRGKLEVLLISAKGLDDSDFFNRMDPYVILTWRSNEQKSTVAKGAGGEPEWNETFAFKVYSSADNSPQLSLKIMDSDTFSADDIVGEASIPLEAVLLEGSLPPTVHRIVKDEEYRGEIKIALTFTSAEENEEEESYGGWNQSA
ncbi:elicitor-responsive protein 3-like [Lolium rigidum]|uniref:elicitor-responsive protein 3-like n=1 Tax=Lolium rigidum TaxID=89674 RepID=UPI001F5CE9C4|nr:elicitor-responsive protein 3-like [Lolium rigidum]